MFVILTDALSVNGGGRIYEHRAESGSWYYGVGHFAASYSDFGVASGKDLAIARFAGWRFHGDPTRHLTLDVSSHSLHRGVITNVFQQRYVDP